MKHTIGTYIFFIALLTSTTLSLGMHPDGARPIVPPLTILVQKSPDIKTELKKVLTAASKADKTIIYSDAFVFTDPDIYTLIFKIAERADSKISIHLHESHHSNKATIALIERYPRITLKTSKQHGKRTLIKYKNNKEEQWHRTVFEGSFNPTKTAVAKNAEISLVSKEQREYYRKHKTSHKNGLAKTYNGDAVLPLTPRNKEVCDTTEFDLCASLAGRVHPEQGGTLYLGTMGYNHAKLHRKLMAFCPHGTVHLLVDFNSINSVSKPLLNQLHGAGAHIVVGNMTKTKKTSRGTFHKKYFVRLPDNENTNLVVIQSANFTKEAHNDFNHASYHPNTPELGTTLIAGHKADVEKGVSYAQFLADEPERLRKKEAAKARAKARAEQKKAVKA